MEKSRRCYLFDNKLWLTRRQPRAKSL